MPTTQPPPSPLGKRSTYDTEHSTTFTDLPNKRARTTSHIPPADRPRPQAHAYMPTNLRNLRPPKVLGKRSASEMITDYGHQQQAPPNDTKRVRTSAAAEPKTKIADLTQAEYEAALFEASEVAMKLASEAEDATTTVLLARLVAFGVEYVKVKGLRPEQVVKEMGAWQFGGGEEVVKAWLEVGDEEME